MNLRGWVPTYTFTSSRAKAQGPGIPVATKRKSPAASRAFLPQGVRGRGICAEVPGALQTNIFMGALAHMYFRFIHFDDVRDDISCVPGFGSILVEFRYRTPHIWGELHIFGADSLKTPHTGAKIP